MTTAIAHAAPSLRRVGRPRGAKTGPLASALRTVQKVAPQDRLTQYALTDAAFGALPIFRPSPRENALTPSTLLDSASTSADLHGYVVRLPRLLDKRHPGAVFEMAVVVPSRAGALEEDLLLVLLSIALAGTADGAHRADLLNVAGDLIVPSTRTYEAQRRIFAPGTDSGAIVSEFVAREPDYGPVTGPFFRVRCSTEVLLRQWRGRHNSRTADLLLRCLERLALISYFVRRAGSNHAQSWGGLGLLRFRHDVVAPDGRDLTVTFPERLVVAMLGFEDKAGKTVRNRFSKVDLRERFALSGETARILHRQLSVVVWTAPKTGRRGRPSLNDVVTATKDLWLDPMVTDLWGRDAASLPQNLLRDRRRLVRTALAEIATLPSWSVTEDEATGRITVQRTMARADMAHSRESA